ncbi:leucyl aminopeptidase [Phenylobacterium sp. SCN 70-31]|uniref:leucyl aminopeptidase n=1 Tax=Phenylobacterium sp. SCN 70-31 TaxID=1660129 RepID=UPI00086836E7|nr:leucyl aminopeptidase [Phenylobacterium sp. SCN 70-31]ODT84386.1 MAG: leucyl aminopeptidase [Phenylobacterium sp. SCN 70-31]
MRFLTAAAVAALFATAALPPTAQARPIRFSAEIPTSGVLVVPAAGETDLALRAPGLDATTRAAVSRGLAAAKFDYKAGSSLTFRSLGGYDEIVVLGAAPAAGQLSALELRKLGVAAARTTAQASSPAALASTGLPAPDEAALGVALGAYAFDLYKSGSRSEASAQPTPFVIAGSGATAAQAAWSRRGGALAEGVGFARDLIAEPPNVLYPEVFAERTRAAFKGVSGTTVEVLDVAAMEKLGMGAILSVGQGSVRPPRMVIVTYKGPGAPDRPLAITGKGITFDTGGISIKPGANMWKMKGDMAGAAAAMGAVLSLAKSNAPVHVVAVAALAENMPGGSAARPGDVVRAHNGRTIERLNTDAEGRIVLADATAYAQSRFKPAAIVNVATLTGAVGSALGDEYAGLFSRHDGLAAQVEAAANATGESVWRLPMHPSYAKDVDSPVADIRDISLAPSAGAGIGAHVIGYFADPTTPWAHLDIAGVSWADSDRPLGPKGGQGFGVMLLDELARNFDSTRAAEPARAGD